MIANDKMFILKLLLEVISSELPFHFSNKARSSVAKFLKAQLRLEIKNLDSPVV